LLTACETTKTIVIKPVIIPVEIDKQPTHEPWQFIAIDNQSFLISEAHLKILVEYVKMLETWGLNGWSSVEYFNSVAERLENIEE